jgi:hypothetical protein
MGTDEGASWERTGMKNEKTKDLTSSVTQKKKTSETRSMRWSYIERPRIRQTKRLNLGAVQSSTRSSSLLIELRLIMLFGIALHGQMEFYVSRLRAKSSTNFARKFVRLKAVATRIALSDFNIYLNCSHVIRFALVAWRWSSDSARCVSSAQGHQSSVRLHPLYFVVMVCYLINLWRFHLIFKWIQRSSGCRFISLRLRWSHSVQSDSRITKQHWHVGGLTRRTNHTETAIYSKKRSNSVSVLQLIHFNDVVHVFPFVWAFTNYVMPCLVEFESRSWNDILDLATAIENHSENGLMIEFRESSRPLHSGGIALWCVTMNVSFMYCRRWFL